MANSHLGAESARENPDAFMRARILYEMACADALEDVEGDEEIMLLGLAETEATEALMLVPAPDAAALAYKLTIWRDAECWNLISDYRDPMFAALIADAHRLAGEA